MYNEVKETDMSDILEVAGSMSDILMKLDDAAKILGISSSTVKSYAQSIETKGYRFTRGNKNEYLFSHEEVDRFRKIIHLKKKMSLEEAIVHSLNGVIDSDDMSDTSNITDISTNSTDISVMLGNISDLSKAYSEMVQNVSDMSRNMSEMSKSMSYMSQNMSGMSEEIKRLEEQNRLLSKELNELKEGQTESRKLLESKGVSNEEVISSMEVTNKMVKEVMEMIAVSKKETKKGFFARLFGRE